MPDPSHLIQERFVERPENKDPEYERLLSAYAEDPLYDMHRPIEQKKEEPKQADVI